MKTNLLSRGSPLVLALCLAPLQVQAADAAHKTQAATDRVTEVEEVIVTTTRRETVLLETPGAVSAIGGDSLVTQGITNATKIDGLVPNLKIQDQQNQGMGAVQISMRGIGNSSFIEIGDPNVGLHVDGVYMSRPQAALNLLFDAQRMEIARGPQGTLYGRNSTVGSINVVNNRPDLKTFSGNVGAELGSYNNRIANGVINIPIINGKFAIRATGFVQKRDTYFDLFTDDVVEKQLNTRYQVNGRPASLNDSPYRKKFGDGLGSNGAGAIDQSAYRVSALLQPTNDLSGYLSYEKFQNNSPAAPQTVRGHEYTAYLSNPNFTDQSIDTIRGEVKYQVANLAEAKLIFGDQKYHHQMLVDLDAGTSRYSPELLGTPQPGDRITFEQTFYDRAWNTHSQSQELTLTSTHGGPLHWMVGLFNFKENTFRDFWIDLPLNGDGIINFNQPSRLAESKAIFGHVDWDISDNLHLSGGLRHTQDKRKDTGVNRFSSFPGNGDFAAWGEPILAQNAGVSDLAYLCSANLPVGPCNGVTPAAAGAVHNVNGGPTRIPGLGDGFAAATGSPIGDIQAGIAAATAPGATVFNQAITTDAQLRQISALLSQNKQVALIGPAGNFPRVFFTEQQFSYNDWNLTLDWKPKEGTFLYGTVATGHKAGSQEIFHHPRLGGFINSTLKPEELVSYEVGVKQKLSMFSGGYISADAFYMNYKNKQQSVFVNGGDLFCASTFGDFNGDGYLENFVQFLGGVPIFATSAALVNNGAILRPDKIGVDGKPEWQLNPAQVAQAIKDCSKGSTPARGPLASTPGMPQFVELMQVNFANANIAGIEVEYGLRFTPKTRVNGYLTWNLLNKISGANPDALPFDLNDSLACGDRVGGCPNIKSTDGNELPFAPTVTFKVGLEHDFDLPNSGYITAGGDVTYNSSYWLSIWNTDCYQSIRLQRQVCNNGDKQKPYATLDLRARYTPPGGRYYVEAYGRNVTNTIYASGNMRPSTDESVTPFSFNPPAMYGVRVGASF